MLLAIRLLSDLRSLKLTAAQGTGYWTKTVRAWMLAVSTRHLSRMWLSQR